MALATAVLFANVIRQLFQSNVSLQVKAVLLLGAEGILLASLIWAQVDSRWDDHVVGDPSVVRTGGETATTSSVATPITMLGPYAQAAGDSVTEVNVVILLSCIFVKALPAGVQSEQQNPSEEKSLQCCSITGIGICQLHSMEHTSSLCLLPPALQSRRYWFMLFL